MRRRFRRAGPAGYRLNDRHTRRAGGMDRATSAFEPRVGPARSLCFDQVVAVFLDVLGSPKTLLLNMEVTLAAGYRICFL
jgi:hypothetical protein